MVQRQTWQAWRFKISESARHFRIESNQDVLCQLHMAENLSTPYLTRDYIPVRLSIGLEWRGILFGTHQRLKSLTNLKSFNFAGTEIPPADHLELEILGTILDSSLTMVNYM